MLVTKAENGEAGAEHTELKEATANQQLRDGGGGDGADTAQSHSSSQSRRSNKSSGYDRLAFPRQDLHNMVLLGETFLDYYLLFQCHGTVNVVFPLAHIPQLTVHALIL